MFFLREGVSQVTFVCFLVETPKSIEEALKVTPNPRIE
jgi:hypothetical protein